MFSLLSVYAWHFPFNPWIAGLRNKPAVLRGNAERAHWAVKYTDKGWSEETPSVFMKDRGLLGTIWEGGCPNPRCLKPVPGEGVGSAGQLLQQAWPCVPLSVDILTTAPLKPLRSNAFSSDLICFPISIRHHQGCQSVSLSEWYSTETHPLSVKTGPFLYSWPQFS